MPQPPYPLHESVCHLLHPEYSSFYNSHIKDRQQVQHQPLCASRTSGVLIPGAGQLLPVGKTQDVAITRKESDGPDVIVRCFTPDTSENGRESDLGWPVVLYFHGGGWVPGNLDTENAVCTNICSRARCVVVTVGYRLAPETPFPAAVHDAWEAFLWLHSDALSLLNIDTTRMAVAGSSAGGNLAAIMAHRSLARSMPALKLQVLVVPVMDNTADTTNNATYRDYEHSPSLPAEKMQWFRDHYLPNKADRSNPEASPLFYPGEDDSSSSWKGQPHALIMVGELDVLRQEGEEYADKLCKASVKYELIVMEKMPHAFLAMDGVLAAGRQAITKMVEACRGAFEIL